MAFSEFMKSLSVTTENGVQWLCCGQTFSSMKQCQQHVSTAHRDDVSKKANEILLHGSDNARWSKLRTISNQKSEFEDESCDLPCKFSKDDVYKWLPISPPV